MALACISPTSCRRELRSGRSKPLDGQLIGTWKMTPESVKAAAATGIASDELKAASLTLNDGGTCLADIFVSPCGTFPPLKRTRGEACRWKVGNDVDGKNILILSIGEGPSAYWMPLNLVDDSGLKLWQYVCDPDNGDLADFVRVEG